MLNVIKEITKTFEKLI